MKKIIDFINKPFTTTFLSVVGLTGGFLFGIGFSKLFALQDEQLQKNKACKEAYKVMCVQVHACTDSTVEECDEMVEKEELCKIKLPDLQIIYSCQEDLRKVECDDRMPASCTLFME